MDHMKNKLRNFLNGQFFFFFYAILIMILGVVDVTEATTCLSTRYIRVELTISGVLQMQEVLVYNDGSSTNIAMGGTATQSSTANAASNCIDGNVKTNDAGTRCQTTNAAGQYWELDLGSESCVNRVVIYNRVDQEDNLASAELVFKDGTDTEVSRRKLKKDLIQVHYGGTEKLYVARKVEITRQWYGYFQIGELEVYSGGTNVALGKTTTPIWGAQFGSYALSKATDGSYADADTAILGVKYNNKIETDLGANYSIERVVVVNRAVLRSRMDRCSVALLDAGGAIVNVEQLGPDGVSVFHFTQAVPTCGFRYLEVWNDESIALTLAEVRVWSNGRNIATNAGISQTTDRYTASVASLCNNGKTLPEEGTHGCEMDAAKSQILRLDFYEDVCIDHLEIFRVQANLGRADGVSYVFKDSNDAIQRALFTPLGSNNYIDVFYLSTNSVIPRSGCLTGRKVRAYKASSSGTTPGALVMAQVEVLVGKTNIALNGTATLSTTNGADYAEECIDGNQRSDTYCQTTATTDMQWEVDLHQDYCVDQINIFSYYSLPERLHGVEISLRDSSDALVKNWTITARPLDDVTENVHILRTYDAPENNTFHQVRIINNHINALNIQEIEVYANGVNVALNKPVQMTTVYVGRDGVAATDGLIPTTDSGFSQTTGVLQPIMQLNLTQAYAVDSVIIYSRRQSGGNHIFGASVLLLDEYENVVAVRQYPEIGYRVMFNFTTPAHCGIRYLQFVKHYGAGSVQFSEIMPIFNKTVVSSSISANNTDAALLNYPASLGTDGYFEFSNYQNTLVKVVTTATGNDDSIWLDFGSDVCLDVVSTYKRYDYFTHMTSQHILQVLDSTKKPLQLHTITDNTREHFIINPQYAGDPDPDCIGVRYVLLKQELVSEYLHAEEIEVHAGAMNLAYLPSTKIYYTDAAQYAGHTPRLCVDGRIDTACHTYTGGVVNIDLGQEYCVDRVVVLGYESSQQRMTTAKVYAKDGSGATVFSSSMDDALVQVFNLASSKSVGRYIQVRKSTHEHISLTEMFAVTVGGQSISYGKTVVPNFVHSSAVGTSCSDGNLCATAISCICHSAATVLAITQMDLGQEYNLTTIGAATEDTGAGQLDRNIQNSLVLMDKFGRILKAKALKSEQAHFMHMHKRSECGFRYLRIDNYANIALTLMEIEVWYNQSTNHMNSSAITITSTTGSNMDLARDGWMDDAAGVEYSTVNGAYDAYQLIDFGSDVCIDYVILYPRFDATTNHRGAAFLMDSNQSVITGWSMDQPYTPKGFKFYVNEEEYTPRSPTPGCFSARFVHISQTGITGPNAWREIQAISGGENVAMSKTVTSSSTGAGDPSYVTDGSHYIHTWYRTASAADQWVEVDLGKEFCVDRLVLVKEFSLYPHTDGGVASLLSADRMTSKNWTMDGNYMTEVFHVVSRPTKAQYIEAVAQKNEYFHIEELLVVSGGHNVSIGKPSKQRSTHGGTWFSSYAVDGDISYVPGEAAHTTSVHNGWVQVNLEEMMEIDSITLFPFDYGASSRLQNSIIMLRDNQHNVVDVYRYDYTTQVQTWQVNGNFNNCSIRYLQLDNYRNTQIFNQEVRIMSNGVNIAPEAAVWQTTDQSGTTVVDNCFDNFPRVSASHPYCQTTAADNQYLTVDLGSEKCVDYIELWRDEAGTPAIMGMYALNDNHAVNFAWTPGTAKVEQFDFNASVMPSTTVEGCIDTKTVKVTLTTGQALTFNEMEIFSGDRNVALGKSTTSTDGTSSMAVDGNYREAGTFATSAGNPREFTVDLGRTYCVHRVVIHNRRTLASSLIDATVELIDSGSSTVKSWTVSGTSSIHTFTTLTTTETVGRYVRVDASSASGLNMREVLVSTAHGGIIPSGKPARQYTLSAAGKEASVCTDGTTTYASNSLICATTATIDAYWMVDLGSEVPVTSVTIYNRADATTTTLDNSVVSVLDANHQVVAVRQQATVGRVGFYNFNSTAYNPFSECSTQYLRIEIGSSNPLHFQELEVWHEGENVAQGKSATQSTTPDSSKNASVCVDGVTDTVSGGQMCTTSTGQDEWWEVDLGGPFCIDRVVIYNRGDTAMAALDQSFLFYKSSTGEILKVKTLNGDGIQLEDSKQDTGYANAIRYVKVMKPYGTIHLREVAVIQQGVSLSVGKTATQSATHSPPYTDGNTADLCADGATNILTDEGVCNTGLVYNAWWELDLSKETCVDKIDVYNRAESVGLGNELIGAYIIFYAQGPPREVLDIKALNGDYQQTIDFQSGCTLSLSLSPSYSKSTSGSESISKSVSITPPPTPTRSATLSQSHTMSQSRSATATQSTTPSQTHTMSQSSSATATQSATPSQTHTMSQSKSATATRSSSQTPSSSVSTSQSLVSSVSVSVSVLSSTSFSLQSTDTLPLSISSSRSVSSSLMPTASLSQSISVSLPLSVTSSVSFTRTVSKVPTPTASVTDTQSISSSASLHPTSTASISSTSTKSGSQTATISRTLTPPPTPTKSSSVSVSYTLSMIETQSDSLSLSVLPTPTESLPATPSLEVSGSESISSTVTFSQSLTASKEIYCGDYTGEACAALNGTCRLTDSNTCVHHNCSQFDAEEYDLLCFRMGCTYNPAKMRCEKPRECNDITQLLECETSLQCRWVASLCVADAIPCTTHKISDSCTQNSCSWNFNTNPQCFRPYLIPTMCRLEKTKAMCKAQKCVWIDALQKCESWRTTCVDLPANPRVCPTLDDCYYDGGTDQCIYSPAVELPTYFSIFAARNPFRVSPGAHFDAVFYGTQLTDSNEVVLLLEEDVQRNGCPSPVEIRAMNHTYIASSHSIAKQSSTLIDIYAHVKGNLTFCIIANDTQAIGPVSGVEVGFFPPEIYECVATPSQPYYKTLFSVDVRGTGFDEDGQVALVFSNQSCPEFGSSDYFYPMSQTGSEVLLRYTLRHPGEYTICYMNNAKVSVTCPQPFVVREEDPPWYQPSQLRNLMNVVPMVLGRYSFEEFNLEKCKSQNNHTIGVYAHPSTMEMQFGDGISPYEGEQICMYLVSPMNDMALAPNVFASFLDIRYVALDPGDELRVFVRKALKSQTPLQCWAYVDQGECEAAACQWDKDEGCTVNVPEFPGCPDELSGYELRRSIKYETTRGEGLRLPIPFAGALAIVCAKVGAKRGLGVAMSYKTEETYCLNDCRDEAGTSHGECVRTLSWQCFCNTGFKGPDCSQQSSCRGVGSKADTIRTANFKDHLEFGNAACAYIFKGDTSKVGAAGYERYGLGLSLANLQLSSFNCEESYLLVKKKNSNGRVVRRFCKNDASSATAPEVLRQLFMDERTLYIEFRSPVEGDGVDFHFKVVSAVCPGVAGLSGIPESESEICDGKGTCLLADFSAPAEMPDNAYRCACRPPYGQSTAHGTCDTCSYGFQKDTFPVCIPATVCARGCTEHGECVPNIGCICHNGYYGLDCNLVDDGERMEDLEPVLGLRVPLNRRDYVVNKSSGNGNNTRTIVAQQQLDAGNVIQSGTIDRTIMSCALVGSGARCLSQEREKGRTYENPNQDSVFSRFARRRAQTMATTSTTADDSPAEKEEGVSLNSLASRGDFPDFIRTDNVSGTDFDIYGAFTLTGWVYATSNTRGFLFAKVDSGFMADGRLPHLEKALVDIEDRDIPLEHMRLAKEGLNVHLAIFMNGPKKRIDMLISDPSRKGSSDKEDWLVVRHFRLGDKGGELFDGTWRFLSIKVEQLDTRIEGQVYIDGYTVLANPNFMQCFPFLPPNLGSHYRPQVQADTSVPFITDGTSIIWGYHLVAALDELQVYRTGLHQRSIVKIGGESAFAFVLMLPDGVLNAMIALCVVSIGLIILLIIARKVISWWKQKKKQAANDTDELEGSSEEDTDGSSEEDTSSDDEVSDDEEEVASRNRKNTKASASSESKKEEQAQKEERYSPQAQTIAISSAMKKATSGHSAGGVEEEVREDTKSPAHTDIKIEEYTSMNHEENLLILEEEEEEDVSNNGKDDDGSKIPENSTSPPQPQQGGKPSVQNFLATPAADPLGNSGRKKRKSPHLTGGDELFDEGDLEFVGSIFLDDEDRPAPVQNSIPNASSVEGKQAADSATSGDIVEELTDGVKKTDGYPLVGEEGKDPSCPTVYHPQHVVKLDSSFVKKTEDSPEVAEQQVAASEEESSITFDGQSPFSLSPKKSSARLNELNQSWKGDGKSPTEEGGKGKSDACDDDDDECEGYLKSDDIAASGIAISFGSVGKDALSGDATSLCATDGATPRKRKKSKKLSLREQPHLLLLTEMEEVRLQLVKAKEKRMETLKGLGAASGGFSALTTMVQSAGSSGGDPERNGQIWSSMTAIIIDSWQLVSQMSISLAFTTAWKKAFGGLATLIALDFFSGFGVPFMPVYATVYSLSIFCMLVLLVMQWSTKRKSQRKIKKELRTQFRLMKECLEKDEDWKPKNTALKKVALLIAMFLSGLYMPVTQMSLQAVFCSRNLICLYDCYNDPEHNALVVVGITGLVFVSLGAPVFYIYTIRRTLTQYHTYLGTFDIALQEKLWDTYVRTLKTPFSGMYQRFTHRWAYFEVINLLFKAAISACLLAASPETTEQLSAVIALQVAFTVFVGYSQPLAIEIANKLLTGTLIYIVVTLLLHCLFLLHPMVVAIGILMIVVTAIFLLFQVLGMGYALLAK